MAIRGSSSERVGNNFPNFFRAAIVVVANQGVAHLVYHMETFLSSRVDAVFVPIYLARLVGQVIVAKLLVLHEFATFRRQHRVENIQALLVGGHTDLVGLRLELAVGGRSVHAHIEAEADHFFLLDVFEGDVLNFLKFPRVNRKVFIV